jgi:p-cumate 2,3-dioxygenase beta subunit
MPDETTPSLSLEAAMTFLADEAAILDEWRLDEWLELFDADGRYLVPTTTLPTGQSPTDVVFIDDGQDQLRGRVARLKSRHAHREYPSSRTRRLITNVRVRPYAGDSPDGGRDELVSVFSNFVVYRFRALAVAAYVGHYEHVLRVEASSRTIRIRHRKAVLDNEYLDEHGAVSIIL